jgi:phosphatidylinositol 4-kinase
MTAFALVLLFAVHATLVKCPLPPLPATALPGMITHIFAIATPSNLVKLVRQSSTDSTPGCAIYQNPFLAPHPTTPAGVVMLVSEVANIILASSVLASAQGSGVQGSSADSESATGLSQNAISNMFEAGFEKVQANQTQSLVARPIADDHHRLYDIKHGKQVWEDANRMVVRWWSELMGDSNIQDSVYARRGSLFTFGGDHDEEVELCVAVLVRPPRCLSLTIAPPEHALTASGRERFRPAGKIETAIVGKV